MKILAISGSMRKASTNTALLREMAKRAGATIEIDLLEDIDKLPIFSQDLEGDETPELVSKFAQKIADADGLIFASPEYVHALPGGLKNAIDWLVSRHEVIDKPIVLMHASFGGEDLLYTLRKVLGTISVNFAPQIFAQFNLRSMSIDDIGTFFSDTKNANELQNFIEEFQAHIFNTQAN
ncbi:MAG: NAD(P)H-dependent oxidoreductase [Alphaproteobacteria bacterium]|nr:NAD(P)H-dependent oxidoreductase [Alphaproteobacteria bacterium]